MQEKKGCGTNTAPPGPNRTISSDNCDDQPPDPNTEGMKLVATSRIDKDGGSKWCRQTKGAKQKRARRSKTKQNAQVDPNRSKDPKQQVMQGHRKQTVISWAEKRVIDVNMLLYAVTLRKSAIKEM